MAFGTQIYKDNIQVLYRLISTIPSEDKLTYLVDEEYNASSISENMIKLIGSFEDVWGAKVDEPLFAVKDVSVSKADISLMGTKNKTLKIMYNGISFIKFFSSEDEYYDIINSGDFIKFTFIGRFKVNNYEGYDYSQVVLTDYKYEKSDEFNGFSAFRF